jgi:hypothetical protein
MIIVLANMCRGKMHNLFRMVSYVSANEETSCITLIHMYENEEDIPGKLEANVKCEYITFVRVHLR